MRRVEVRDVRYSLESKCECEFRLVYEVSDGPRKGTEKWFKLEQEELATSR
jgi:hypothetical protein